MKYNKILIVEDNAVIAMEMKITLEDLGYQITGSEFSAEKAIQFLKNPETELPDLVLIDIKLKGTMDGIELAGIIKKHCNLAYIFITGNTDKATKEEAMVLNPLAYLYKPIDYNILNDIMC